MTERYRKSEIAIEQLKTAIFLLIHELDLSSAITLAGAASGILEQLVRNAGKVPFVDYAREIANHYQGATPPRSSYSRHINDWLGINDHKHMSADTPETLEIDLQKSAEDAIAKAVADFVTLYGQDHDFIQAYLRWMWINRNGPELMENYKQFPERLKRK
jgi:hypothetical protein